MKITFVGLLTLAAVVVLLGMLAYQIAIDLDKSRQKNNEQRDGSY